MSYENGIDFCKDEYGTVNMMGVQVQILQDQEEAGNRRLFELKEQQEEIENRIKAAEELERQLLQLQDQLEDSGNKDKVVSLDEYEDLINYFRNEVQPALREENSPISEAHFPIQETFNIENVTKAERLDLIDRLGSFVNDSTNSLTHLARDFDSASRTHFLIATAMVELGAKGNRELDTIVKNMGRL